MRRALPLTALLLLASACGRDAPPSGRAVLERAAAWLWSQQADDGGWHSETYGLLRSGQSLTPFVLDALLDLPADLDRAPDVLRATDFLARHVDADGALGRADPLLEDYPNYATALGLRALRAVQQGPGTAAARMERCLLRQQLRHGWDPAHPAYGAWGMGGAVRTPPDAGHLDISMTRYVLEALADARPSESLARAREAAGVFLRRLESAREDGRWGYAFSTVLGEKNKAGPDGAGRYRPYGSATADGVLCALAARLPVNRAGVRGPVGWLVAHHRLDHVPGLHEGPAAGWGVAMRYYYFAAVARVFHRCGIEEAPRGRAWRTDLVAALAREQRADGSFAAGVGLMKEDDPLIATALAVKALAAAMAAPGP